MFSKGPFPMPLKARYCLVNGLGRESPQVLYMYKKKPVSNYSLNILIIRRYIVSDMRIREEQESVTSEDLLYVHKPKVSLPKMSYRGLVSDFSLFVI